MGDEEAKAEEAVTTEDNIAVQPTQEAQTILVEQGDSKPVSKETTKNEDGAGDLDEAVTSATENSTAPLEGVLSEEPEAKPEEVVEWILEAISAREASIAAEATKTQSVQIPSPFIEPIEENKSEEAGHPKDEL